MAPCTSMRGCGPRLFEALANLPEPRKPEASDMDLLQSVSATQPQDIVLLDDLAEFEPDSDEPASCGKQMNLDSRSTTCTQTVWDQMTDQDIEEIGTQSFNSYLSFSKAAVSSDHLLPPNRLSHEQNNVNMEGFLKAAGHAKVGCQTCCQQ